MHRHQYQLGIKLFPHNYYCLNCFISLSIAFSSKNGWQTYASSPHFLSSWWPKWDNNCMHLTLQNNLTESTNSGCNYESSFQLNAIAGMSNPILANRSAQDADHLMLPGKYPSKCGIGSWELTNHSSAFRSTIIWICALAIFSDTIASLPLRQEERYVLAIRFIHLTCLFTVFRQRLMQ